MSKRIYIALLCAFIVIALPTARAFAQDRPSGALDFGIDYHRSTGGSNLLGVHARAMAVDRVPGTLVGRFAELYASIGVGLEGEFVQYAVGAKFGVGLGTDYLVVFLATGLMTDSYQSVKKNLKTTTSPLASASPFS